MRSGKRWRLRLRALVVFLLMLGPMACDGRGCADSAADSSGKPLFRNLGKRGDSDLPRRQG